MKPGSEASAIGGATDAGLEHAAGTRADPRLDAHVVRPTRLVEAAHERGLDAYHRARAELDRVAGDAGAGDRLVEADRAVQERGQPRVIEERVGGEGLLQTRDAERVERDQAVRVGEVVTPVGVDLDGDGRTDLGPHRGRDARRRDLGRS